MPAPDRRGSFTNTAVWSSALVAIAALTVWKFEIWPVGWVATETGTIAEAPAGSERLAAGPIEVAGPGEDSSPSPEKRNPDDPGPPPAELAALELTGAIPALPQREPPTRPSEPNRLPEGASSRPLPALSVAPATGADFAPTGLFPESTIPAAPRQPIEPAESEVLPLESLQPASGESGANRPATAGIVTTSAEAPPTKTAELTTAAASTSSPSPETSLAAIDADIAAGRYLAAHKALSKIYWDEPPRRAAIQARIDATARSIYFDPQPHYMTPCEVQPGDQLRLLARNYDVPWEYLARLNRIDDPSRVQAGQSLKVIKGPFSAVVDLDDFALTVHAHGYYVCRFPVGVGKEGATPVGRFRVLLKEPNPKYWGPDGVVLDRDDPANPLGEHWIALDDGAGNSTSYGIHGTIDAASIGKAESRGCVRLRNEDVAILYDLLGVGSEVLIRRGK